MLKSLHDLCIKDKRIAQLSSKVDVDEGRIILNKLHNMFNPNEGVGLAAPQIGIFKRVCIVHIKDYMGDTYKIDFINPVIIETSNETIRHEESCFSVLGKAYVVQRYASVTIKDDVNNTIKLSGYPSYVAQHEIDHLDGITIADIGRPTVPQPIVRDFVKFGRNDLCVCGSGKKFKKCCME